MKAHIGVDADSGLVHTVRGTSGHVGDVTEGNSLLHGQETEVFGDAGYQGIDKRPDAKSNVTWHIAMKPGKGRALSKDKASDVPVNLLEKLKAGIRAKVEHPFALPGIEEKHGPTGHTVCAFQLVDGAGQVMGGAGIGAPANMQTAGKP